MKKFFSFLLSWAWLPIEIIIARVVINEWVAEEEVINQAIAAGELTMADVGSFYLEFLVISVLFAVVLMACMAGIGGRK